MKSLPAAWGRTEGEAIEMNLLNAIVRQIDIEHRLSELYRLFFRRFRDRPVLNTFWLQMSNEEAGHENLLRTILDILDDNPAEVPDAPAIGAERFERLEAEISRCILEAKGPLFSLPKAFAMAIQLESGEAEILYRYILENLDPKFDNALTEFITENLEHKRRLQSMSNSVQAVSPRG